MDLPKRLVTSAAITKSHSPGISHDAFLLIPSGFSRMFVTYTFVIMLNKITYLLTYLLFGGESTFFRLLPDLQMNR